jgi:hypothetical protein
MATGTLADLLAVRGGVRAVAGRRLDPNSASRLPLKIASYESSFQKPEVQSAGVGVVRKC